MSRILVVGGAGYIGGYLVDKLKETPNKIIVYDNLLYETRYLKDVDFIYGDIRNTKKVIESAKECDIIILLAALVGDPACSIDPQLTEEINYKAIKNICQNLPKNKHIIFISTCSVYGHQDLILTEKSPTNPLSAYASTKLAAEKYILDRNGTVFRLGTVYGLGDTYSRIRMDLVVNVLTMKALKYKEIIINGGAQWRPIISVKDVAGYIIESCYFKPSGIFIISQENVKIIDLGEKIADLIPETKINLTEIAFQDARNYKVDTKKVDETFSYKCNYNITTEVLEIKRILEENRIKNPEEDVYHNGLYVKKIKEMKII